MFATRVSYSPPSSCPPQGPPWRQQNDSDDTADHATMKIAQVVQAMRMDLAAGEVSQADFSLLGGPPEPSSHRAFKRRLLLTACVPAWLPVHMPLILQLVGHPYPQLRN